MLHRTLAFAVAIATASAAHAFTLEAPRIEAKLYDASSRDPFRIRARIAGVDPSSFVGGNVLLRFGPLTAEIPAGGFRRHGGAFAWKSYRFGVKKVVLNVKNATVDIIGGRTELGSLPDPVTLVITTPSAVMCGHVTWTDERVVGGRNPRRRATIKLATGPIESCGALAAGDRIPPNVRITTPTEFAGMTTGSATITLGGVASDAGAVTALSWTNDRGGGGVLPVAADWTIDGVVLQPGDNHVTVTATDASGNVGSDALDVTYNTNGIVFDGLPLADPDALFVGQFGTGSLRQAIVPNPDLDPDSVRLERITDTGELAPVGEMRDDGNLDAVGDEIQGDSVYTGKLPVHSNSAGVDRFRVSARTRSDPSALALGPVLTFPYVARIADEDFTEAIDLANDARTLLGNLHAQGVADDEALGEVVGLALARGVQAAGPSDGGRGAWWVTRAGLLGGVLGHDQSTVRGGNAAVPPPVAPASSRPRAVAADGVLQQVGSRQSIILAPYFSDAEPQAIDAMLRGSTCPVYEVQTYVGADATADRFKDLDQYGIIVIASHGDALFGGIADGYRSEWGWGSVGSQVVVLTATQLASSNLRDWEKDLRLGRMAIMPDGVVAILPSFVNRYSIRFPASVVYVGACGSSTNGTLASAFFGRGAATYFGYDGYVGSSFAGAAGSQLFTRLLAGMATGDAFTAGTSDGTATLTMDGLANASLTAGIIVNPGFEIQSRFAASVPGFTVTGDGRVVGGLGLTTPTAGQRMALVSTGLGFTTAAGSFEQPICIPPLPPGASAWTLNFDWKFFSEEFLEYCGSQFQDSFEVSYAGTPVFSVKIDDLCAIVSPTPDVKFDKGDVYATPWTTQSVDMTTYAGTTGVLRFAAKDVGDSIYDSAILVDQLAVSPQ